MNASCVKNNMRSAYIGVSFIDDCFFDYNFVEKKHMNNNNITPLVDDLRQIINEARNRVAVNVNAELTLMYWHIGERINREVLGNERAEYGKQIVAAVSRQLQKDFGSKGFDEKSIRRMMNFVNRFPDFQIVAQLARQLSWSHFIEILPLKDGIQQEFYLTLAASERWSTRQLRKEIDGMLFERSAISGKPDELIKKELTELRQDNTITPDLVFKSPYFLEFTGLKGMYSEKTLTKGRWNFICDGLSDTKWNLAKSRHWDCCFALKAVKNRLNSCNSTNLALRWRNISPSCLQENSCLKISKQHANVGKTGCCRKNKKTVSKSMQKPI